MAMLISSAILVLVGLFFVGSAVWFAHPDLALTGKFPVESIDLSLYGGIMVIVGIAMPVLHRE